MKYFAQINNIRLLLSSFVLVALTVSCNEKIDEEYMRTAQEPTILEYLETGKFAANYTEYVNLLKQVPVSFRSTSTVAQLLSARGHYTCFAPNNQAIYDYLQELKEKDIINEASWDGFRSEATLDSVRKVIVYNSIIDGSNTERVIEMGDIMAKGEHEEFLTPNLNNRKIYKITIDGEYYINGVARIDPDRRDVKSLNGRVHEVHAVIAPSNDTMTDVFRQMVAERKKGFLVMAKLILACGLEDTLSKTQDDVWENMVLNEEVKDLPYHPTEGEDQTGSIPLHRKYGFTIFSETDAFWEGLIGKTYDQITVEDIKTKLIELGAYPNARQDNDYTNEENIINQFVTYHILPEKLVKGRLVIHYNEKGFNYKTSGSKFTIPVYDYYTTMGKRRLLKIYQSAESAKEDPNPSDWNAGIYLNRFPILHNARGLDNNEEDLDYNTYHEFVPAQFKDPGSAHTIYLDENKGVRVKMEAEDNAEYQNLTNSCIYPLDRLLVYTENVQNRLFGERIRIDMSTMFPEMINNDLRRPYEFYPEGSTRTKAFPVEYPYLADVQMETGTKFYYLSGTECSWSNYQMDEFNIIGTYEFTMKLPPVPKKGQYEIRFGVSSGSSWRSMCQVYFGSNKNYLPAKNIPMDLRIGFQRHRFRSGDQSSNFGYSLNGSDYSEEANLPMEDQDEINKALKTRGFMKGPKYFHIGYSTNALLGNQAENVTRRIMVSEELDPDLTYYIRFKNVLNNDQLQFFMDYFEFVSKEVYDNPVEPEDIW